MLIEYLSFCFRADSGERVVVIVNLSGSFRGKSFYLIQ